MFGGMAGSTELGDTWLWDGNSWTEQHPALSPSPRSGAVMAYDAIHHQVVLFGGHAMGGGFAGSEASPEAQTWTWDGSLWHLVTTAHTPRPVADGMGFDPGIGQLLLVGIGEQPVTAYAQQLQGGVVTHTLAPRPSLGSGVAPVPVPAPSGAVVGVSGGGAVHVPLRAVPQEPMPLPIQGHLESGGTVSTWVWTGSDWSPRDTSSAAHGSLGGMWPAWDASQRQMLLVTVDVPQCGAPTASQPLPVPAPLPAATGVARGGSAGWTGYAPIPTPVPSATAKANVFGVNASSASGSEPAPALCAPLNGSTAGSCLNCAHVHGWTWNGKAWLPTQALGPQPPWWLLPDAATGSLMSVASSTTLERSGARWHSTTNPAALQRRSGEALAADTDHNVVVLFGGRTLGAPGYGSDTWTWDGHAWTQRGGTPPPRQAQFVPAQNPCGNDTAPNVTIEKKVPDSVVITLAFAARSTCPPFLLLRDAQTESPLAVQGGSVTLSGQSPQVLVWRNWCGSGQPELFIRMGSASEAVRIAMPPGCSNRSQSSTLTFGHPGASVVP
jgi:hypothetical protein